MAKNRTNESNAVTAEQYRAIVTGRTFAKDEPKRPKYRAEKTAVDGITFDSKREAHRYLELTAALKVGKIRNLRTQYVYAIVIDGVRVCDYRADFVYEEPHSDGWRTVTEDAKGMRTREYVLKKKLMLAVHGIAIRET